MSGLSHDGIRRLIVGLLAEDALPDGDRRALEGHLAECAACTDLLQEVRLGLTAIRLERAQADPRLVAGVQDRLRARAGAPADRPALSVPALIACATLSLVMTLATVVALGALWDLAPWHVEVSLPAALAAGIVLWLLPSCIAAVAAASIELRPARSAVV